MSNILKGIKITESTLKEFASSGSNEGGNYFKALASAWYNGVFDTGSLQKGIKSQQDIERILQRGVVAPDGKTRKYAIDYNSDFDGVVISSDDYYEHSDYNDKGQEVDSRSGQPWGPYDYMEFSDDDLDEIDESLLGFLSPQVTPKKDKLSLSTMRQIEKNRAEKEKANPKVIRSIDLPKNPDYVRTVGVDEEKDSYTVANDPDKPGMHSYREVGHAVRSGHSDSAKIYKNNKFLGTVGDVRKKDVAENNDHWGSQGRFVGDTGPTQLTTTVARVQLKPGDRVLYKPTEQRATIEAMSSDGTKARIHIATPMGGKTFNCKTSDLKAIGQGVAEADAALGSEGYRVTWTEVGQKSTTGLLMKSGALEIAKKLKTKPGTSDVKVVPYSGVAEAAPIIVPRMMKAKQKAKSSMSGGMDPAKAQGIEDAQAGKPYNNPYPFKPELGAVGNQEHNMYKAAYDSAKKGVAEGWKDKVGAAALVAAPIIGGIGANMAAPNTTIQGHQAQLATSSKIPNNAKLVTDEKGNKVYVWTVTSSNPKSAGSHKQLVYRPAENLNEFAPDDGGESRKFIPWTEFVDQLKQILHKDFDCKESINQDVIKAKFVPYDPMELGPTQIYSYFERRLGRDKGANSVRGQIQVGKFSKGQSGLITGYHLLKGTEFERYFDLTFENLYKIANIIKGNTQGRLEAEQQVNEFAPDSNDGGEEDALHKYAKMWWEGDEATQLQIEKVLDRMGWEIGEDEGSYDNGGVFVVRAGDINGNSYQSWPAEELTEQTLEEKWSQKYKNSINCSHPKGFSQKAHCAGKKKHNESIEMESVCPDCGMCEVHADHENLDEACWEGYHKEGNKKMFGKTYPNCVKNTNEEQELNEFAPGSGDDDGEDYDLEYQVYQCNPENEFEFIGGPLYQNSDLGRAHDIAYKLHMKHPDKAFMIYQPSNEFSRGGYGIKDDEQELDEYGDTAKGQKILTKVQKRAVDRVTSKKADTDPKYAKKNQDTANAAYDRMTESHHSESCPHCGGPMFSEMIMNEKKDACYYKVKSRYKVWPSAYASGALVKCRKKGASNWGNSSKNESVEENLDENLHKWFQEKWVRFGPDGKIRGACARGDDSEGKPKCLPQAKAHSLGKKGRKYAASKKRREDPNPERRGPAKNVATKKKSNEGYDVSNDETSGVAYNLGRSAFRTGANLVDNPYSATKEARKNNEWVKGWHQGKDDKFNADKIRGNKVVDEAANPAQQAAIAIAMKKAGKKPKKTNEASNKDEADYGYDYQQMVKRLGQKAKEQEKKKPVDIDALAKRINQPEKKNEDALGNSLGGYAKYKPRKVPNEVQLQKRKSAIRSGLDGVDESLGNNYPGTWEQENKPFIKKGAYRITSMTSESENE